MSETPALPRADQPTEMEHYVPLSGMAIAAFVLSLFSPIALYNPGLAVVAMAPVILGLLASIRIFRSAHPVKGRSLAVASLALSMFFISTSVIGHTMMRNHLSHQGQVHFSEWLELVAEGKLREAHELHRQYSDRQLPGTDLEAIYTKEVDDSSTDEEQAELVAVMLSRDFSPKQELESFFDNPPVSDIVAHANDAIFEFVSVQEAIFKRPDSEIAMVYRMTYPQGGVNRETEFMVRMMRSRYEGGEFHWHVFDINFPPREQ